MSPILEGIRVLDLTEGMAGSMASMILADNGAEVIKVERPGGDPYRSQAAWVMWNRGKRSVVLDLNTPAGKEAAQQLAQQVDVLIENFAVGAADRLGLGYDTLSRLNPRLIYCSITGFGSQGRYRNFKPYNSIIEAKSGGMQRGRRLSPTYRVRPRGDYGSATMTVQGIAAALRVREMTGLGQRLETTHFAAVIFQDSGGAVGRQAELGMVAVPSERLAQRRQRFQLGVSLTYLNVRCKDGQWLQLANNGERLFRNFIRAIGLDGIYQDARFKGAPRRFASREDALELRRIVYQKMQEKTLDEWIEIFLKEDVAGDRYLTTQQAMDHVYLQHLQGVVEIDDPNVGVTRQIGPLVRFRDTPSVIGKPSPTLGEHTDAVLKSIHAGPERAATAGGATALLPKHPFEGMLLLDFSTWNAAPQGASLIADLGARVIKIEPPDQPDDARQGNMGLGRTLQGKESMAIDLKTTEGREIVYRLIAKADGLVHNMRMGAPERLGLDYESVRQINPTIVYLYAGSYGSTGPGAPRAAFHPIAGCLTGGPLWQLGKGNYPPAPDAPMTMEEIERWSEALMEANESTPDQMSALGVGTALALALYHKARTGQGQYVETSMLTSNLYLVSDDFIRFKGKPARLEPDQALRGLHALHRLYEAKEGWIFLTCPLEEEWRGLCKALDRQDLLADPRYATAEKRLQHDEWLVAELWPSFKERTAAEWETYLDQFDVACARADGTPYPDFLLLDEGIKEAGLVVDIAHATTGSMKRVSPAVAFSLTPGRAGAPHLFGEDTPSILRELGSSEAAIQELRAKRIVTWEEPAPAATIVGPA